MRAVLNTAAVLLVINLSACNSIFCAIGLEELCRRPEPCTQPCVAC